MITITKQNDGVLFTFENSDKYLYGNGTIEVPFNTLSIVADESDMITLKKAASNDVFISVRYDTDLGYRSKDDAIDDLKDLLFAETGGGSESGITSGEVQTMIDESISGKADTSDVTAVASDVQTVSGQVATKVAISDFNAYSAATDARIAEDEEVTAAALNDLDENKQDALVYYTEDTSNESATIMVQNDDGLGNRSEKRVFVNGGDIIIESFNETDDGEGNTGTTDTQVDINSLGLSIITYSDDGIDTTQTELKVQPMGAYINSEPIATEPYVDAALSGKADTSAVTAAIDDAKAYYISFATLATVGIHDEDWDGIVAAIDDHRPIYAGYPRTDGGIIYYGVECMNKNSGNTEIVMTASDDNQHYFYTFVKNGSNDYSYTVSTKPYVPDITTAITSGSTDAQVPSAKATYDAIQAGGGGGAGLDDDTQQLISTAFNDLNDRKADLTELLKYQKKGDYVKTPTLANYMTNDAFDEYATAKERIISGALNDLNDKFGGLRLVKISQTDYDNLTTKDENTLYIINNVI